MDIVQRKRVLEEICADVRASLPPDQLIPSVMMVADLAAPILEMRPRSVENYITVTLGNGWKKEMGFRVFRCVNTTPANNLLLQELFDACKDVLEKQTRGNRKADPAALAKECGLPIKVVKRLLTAYGFNP